jgi:hypothetical protein
MRLFLRFLKHFLQDETDPRWLQISIAVILIWYIIDMGFFFFIGAVMSDLQTIFTGIILIFWLALTALIFRLSRTSTTLNEKFNWLYLPIVFVLAIVEETIIYLNGGGLGGAALSLQHDLLLAVPVFLGIGTGIYILHFWKRLYSGEFFLLGAIQGFIIEVIFTGNILGVWLFGGAALGIYGAMMGALAPKIEDHHHRSTRSTILLLIAGMILCFVGVIVGAIIGDNLYSIFGA